MNSIIDQVYNNLIEYSMLKNGDKVVVGLSGGADSVMLLTALLKLKNIIGYEVSAAHINHGIRGKSADDDCAFCEDLCKSYGVVFHSVYYNIPQIATELKTSEENAGRIKRYEFFNELCSKYGYNKIAVAHNMNDSVETVIINMIRGSSLAGMCGIKPVNSNVIRPIFNVLREEIEMFLHDSKIDFCTDETNFENDYTRNKVRNNILEFMKEINPSVVRTVFSNTRNFKEDDDFICSEAKKTKCVSLKNDDVVIDKSIFDNQHIAVRKRIILDAFKEIKGDLKNIEKKHLDILLGNLSSGKSYNMPDGITVLISFNEIVLTKNVTESLYEECKINPGVQTKFADCFVSVTVMNKLEMIDHSALYVDFDKLHGDLVLRSRKDGDRFIPYGMNGTKKIKQLFSELKIPFDQREKVPLLCDEKEIVAVIPYRISEHYKIDKNTTKVLKIEITKEI